MSGTTAAPLNIFVALVTTADGDPSNWQSDRFNLLVKASPVTFIAEFKEMVKQKASPVLDHLAPHQLAVFHPDDRAAELGAKRKLCKLNMSTDEDGGPCLELYVRYETHSPKRGRESDCSDEADSPAGKARRTEVKGKAAAGDPIVGQGSVALDQIDVLRPEVISVERKSDEYYDRDATMKAASQYLVGVPNRSPEFFIDNKFSMFGASGMKGIGKTEALKQIAAHLLPTLSAALGRKYESLYVTFNGGGTDMQLFLDRAAGSPRAAPSYDRAFGTLMVKQCCRIEPSAIPDVEFKIALATVRRAHAMADGDVLVVLVDEIGHLGDETAAATMQALMSQMDAAGGTLIFIFTHILEGILNSGATGSGRRVVVLPLQPVQLQTWRAIDGLAAAAAKFPALHQLFLSCSGHPRSIFDGIKAARKGNPTLLLSNPASTEIDRARQCIISECKFSDISDKRLNIVVPQWFNFKATNAEEKEKLQFEGLLHTVCGFDSIEFLFPLQLQHWATRHSASNNSNNSVAFHLHKLYAHDALIDADAEKQMEPIMYHYEAVLRKANEGKVFTLQAFYQTKHVGKQFRDVRVTAPVPERDSLVQYVDKFSDVDGALCALNQGFIVVSTAHSELGIEYMAPFRDAVTHDLIVACVQCKFVDSKAKWTDIGTKLEEAMKPLKEKKVRCFPVVYTTAEQRRFNSGTLDGVDGLYFIESDIFRFTSKLGILRLHTQKLGRALAQDYPFLNATAANPQGEEGRDMV